MSRDKRAKALMKEHPGLRYTEALRRVRETKEKNKEKMSKSKDAEKPVKPVCKSFEGCRGDGCIYDLSDSGSGRTCYCDCQAGIALKVKEDDQDLPINPIYGVGL